MGRIPYRIRRAKNLPLLLETAVELARRKAVIEPGIVVPQGYQGRIQYLLPVYLTNMKKPDLAMTLSVMSFSLIGKQKYNYRTNHLKYSNEHKQILYSMLKL